MKCPYCEQSKTLAGHDRDIGVVNHGKARKVPAVVVTCDGCQKILGVLLRNA